MRVGKVGQAGSGPIRQAARAAHAAPRSPGTAPPPAPTTGGGGCAQHDPPPKFVSPWGALPALIAFPLGLGGVFGFLKIFWVL